MTTLYDLTRCQVEILYLIPAHHTNKAIAAEIFVSEKTIEFHLDNLYRKFGVQTRLMARLWAIQHGVQAETREIPS